jgi:tetratricopeptide (TPR) repeat protein
VDDFANRTLRNVDGEAVQSVIYWEGPSVVAVRLLPPQNLLPRIRQTPLMRADKAFELGANYLDAQEFEMALIAFGEAIRLDPKMAQALNGRAVVYGLKDDFEKALADASEALRLDPWEPEYYRTRAFVYERLGRMEESAADLEKADQLATQWDQRAKA